MTNTDIFAAIKHFEASESHKRLGHNSYSWYAKLTPAEFLILFDALRTHIELLHMIEIEWAMTEDVEFGEVTLRVWEDNAGEVLADVAVAYCRINDISV